MTIDLSKLTPAPWFVDPKNDCRVRSLVDAPGEEAVELDEAFCVASTHTSSFAPGFVIARENAKAIALLRNALDIQFRRGWWVAPGVKHGEERLRWAAQGPWDHQEPGIDGKWHDDPASALCAAEAWYVANCEGKAP